MAFSIFIDQLISSKLMILHRLSLVMLFAVCVYSFNQAQSVPIILDPPGDVYLSCVGSIPFYLPDTPLGGPCPPDAITTASETLSNDYLVYDVHTPLTSSSATSPRGLLASGLGAGITPEFAWVAEESRLFVSESNAYLIGKAYNSSEPDFIFEVFIELQNGDDYVGWSSQQTVGFPIQNRTYRDDLELAADGGNLWEDWRYYEVNVISSYFTGLNQLSGAGGEINHIPQNYLYGFQIGEAANSLNDAVGFSAWVSFDGYVAGQPIATLATIAADLTLLGTVGDLYCSEPIIETYTVEDACGRENSVSRVVYYNAVFAADFNADGVVDVDDFVIFNSSFGEFCPFCPEDLNGNNVVNIDDFIIFNSLYGN